MSNCNINLFVFCDKVKCLSVDYGGAAFFADVNDLREVYLRFLDLAAQAFHVKLAGLENFEHSNK